MEDFHESGRFIDLEWVKKLNGIPGLIAIMITFILVAIIILTFIRRIFQNPDLRKRYFVADNTQSVPTRILKVIVFLLLTAGLIGVITYNVYKMIHDPPKLSVTVEENKTPPSMLFCGDHGLRTASARYYDNFSYDKYNNPYKDISNNSFDLHLIDVSSENANNLNKCLFFDGNSIPKLNSAGGYYELDFVKNYEGSSIIVFIGDTNKQLNWSLAIPKADNVFSDVGYMVILYGGVIQYTETRHQVLNGSYMYRSFQLSTIFMNPNIGGGQTRMSIGIVAPSNVVTQVEEPPLTIIELFSNIGGYLGIWGIFAFLFGGNKVDPFGFVSRFVFIKQDRAKLCKELKRMKGDRSVKLNISENEKDVEEVSETFDLSNQTEFRNLLAKYYVETDFYEHAVKAPYV